MAASVWRRTGLATAVAAGWLAAGCAGVETRETGGFERVDDAPVDYAFSRPGADFSRFDKVRLMPVSVWYPREQGQRLDDAQLRLLQAYYERAVTEALTHDGRYRVVDEPGPGVLELHPRFIDMKSPGNQAAFEEVQARYRFPLERGKATLVVDLVDAGSGEILSRAADVERESEYAGVTGLDPARAEARAALRRWAGMLRAFLDAAHGDQKTP